MLLVHWFGLIQMWQCTRQICNDKDTCCCTGLFQNQRPRWDLMAASSALLVFNFDLSSLNEDFNLTRFARLFFSRLSHCSCWDCRDWAASTPSNSCFSSSLADSKSVLNVFSFLVDFAAFPCNAIKCHMRRLAAVLTVIVKHTNSETHELKSQFQRKTDISISIVLSVRLANQSPELQRKEP